MVTGLVNKEKQNITVDEGQRNRWSYQWSLVIKKNIVHMVKPNRGTRRRKKKETNIQNLGLSPTFKSLSE